MIEYAIYLRKSRADLELEQIGSGETLSRHKKILLDLATKNNILENQIQIYQEVVSGESIAARPEVQKLLSNVYQRKYKAVLVMEIERLARGNTKDQGEVSDAFQYSNTKIITPSKIYDPSNEFDQEFFEFGLFMSRREYQTIKRRMAAGKIQSVHEGNYLGTVAPFGYSVKRINKKERTLVIDEAESQIVQFIFDQFTNERKTPGQIAKELTQMKIQTRTGMKEWQRKVVSYILQNPVYIGKIRWNNKQDIKVYDQETGKMIKKTTQIPENIILVPGHHQPIINEEQFEKAQKLFEGNLPVQIGKDLSNPLAGLLICKDCKKKIRYNCYATKKCKPRLMHPDSVICRKKSCDFETVIESITAALKAYLDDFEVIINNDSYKEEKAKAEATIDILKNELNHQEKIRSRLFDFLENGSYTQEEFLERKQKCNQTIQDLKQQIQQATKEIPEESYYLEKVETLHHAIDLINDPSIKAKTKNDFLKGIIDHIDYDSEDLGFNHGTKPILDIYVK